MAEPPAPNHDGLVGWPSLRTELTGRELDSAWNAFPHDEPVTIGPTPPSSGIGGCDERERRCWLASRDQSAGNRRSQP